MIEVSLLARTRQRLKDGKKLNPPWIAGPSRIVVSSRCGLTTPWIRHTLLDLKVRLQTAGSRHIASRAIQLTRASSIRSSLGFGARTFWLPTSPGTAQASTTRQGLQSDWDVRLSAVAK